MKPDRVPTSAPPAVAATFWVRSVRHDRLTTRASTIGRAPSLTGLTCRITVDAAMMQNVRTTVDLPPAVHRRAQDLAASRGQSLSAVIAELTIRGLGQLDEPVRIEVDPRSGFPVMSFGGSITSEDVAKALDDE